MALSRKDIATIQGLIDERINRSYRLARIDLQLKTHGGRIEDLEREVRKNGIEMEHRDHDITGILGDMMSYVKEIPELRQRIEALETRLYPR